MFTEIVFEDKGELQRWKGTEEGFNTTHPEAEILNIQENETEF